MVRTQISRRGRNSPPRHPKLPALAGSRLLSFAALVLSTAAGLSAQPSYTAIDIGAVFGIGLNNSGQIVGSSNTGSRICARRGVLPVRGGERAGR